MCGSADPWTPSSCVLSPPDEGPLSERILTATVLSQVVREMALVWEPEFGLATSSEHYGSMSSRPKMGALPGWVMYFSRQRGTVPPLPAPVRVEPVADLGTLVVLTQERFTVTNPDHVALASKVQQVLDAAGLLHPLRLLS
nr:immunity 52 family protein [Corallococcus macrosporus]